MLTISCYAKETCLRLLPASAHLDPADPSSTLQRGIDLTSLDVSYFTSLSYYILLLFGARGVFSLVFR